MSAPASRVPSQDDPPAIAMRGVPRPGPVGTEPPKTRGPRPRRGGAQAFRREQERSRRARWELLGDLVVIAIIVAGIYAISTARPTSPDSVYVPPPEGPPIHVEFGTPTVGAIACDGGATAYAERIPWIGSSMPLRTGDINVRVYEIWDSDWIGDPGVVASVTPTSVCAGPAPVSMLDWYAVLAAPNGTNLLLYTDATAWAPVNSGPWNIWVENDSSIVIVTNPAIAQTGRGFAVFGFENGSTVLGTTPL